MLIISGLCFWFAFGLGFFVSRGMIVWLALVFSEVVVVERWVEELPGAEVEVAVPYGRCDVVVNGYAIEVGRVATWRQDVGQAVCYAVQLGLRPGVAFIGWDEAEAAARAEIERVLAALGVRRFALPGEIHRPQGEGDDGDGRNEEAEDAP